MLQDAKEAVETTPPARRPQPRLRLLPPKPPREDTIQHTLPSTPNTARPVNTPVPRTPKRPAPARARLTPELSATEDSDSGHDSFEEATQQFQRDLRAAREVNLLFVVHRDMMNCRFSVLTHCPLCPLGEEAEEETSQGCVIS